MGVPCEATVMVTYLTKANTLLHSPSLTTQVSQGWLSTDSASLTIFYDPTIFSLFSKPCLFQKNHICLGLKNNVLKTKEMKKPCVSFLAGKRRLGNVIDHVIRWRLVKTGDMLKHSVPLCTLSTASELQQQSRAGSMAPPLDWLGSAVTSDANPPAQTLSIRLFKGYIVP